MRIHGIQSGAEMPDLGNCRSALSQQFAIEYTSAADSGAGGEIKDAVSPSAGSVTRSGQRREVAIISDDGKNLELLLAPLDKRKIIPAEDLVTLKRSSRDCIHGAAKTNADAIDA